VCAGCWTLLNVDPTVKGALQVRAADGQWIPADPVDGALVVNIGDLLSLWSCGLYQSTPHRVVNHITKTRVSVPFFFDPNFTAPAMPLAALRSRATDAVSRQRVEAVRQRMGFAEADDGRRLFGEYHLKKVSSNFEL
jgi:isopenicillin N synthase-like dioxygenase